jgi:membrane-associated PAP2 superfamily phosphatase
MLLVAALLAVSGLFFAAPGLDLAASRVFASVAGGFPLSDSPVLLALRDWNRALPAWIALAVGLVLLARGFASPGRTAGLPRPSAVLVVLGTYALAPLGVVHLLKNTFGRARPHDVVAFGGDHVFTAVWQVSEACARNCSFASGEAASAAVLPVLVLLLPRRWRPAALVVLVPFAIAASVNRMAFGSHFLSDVLVSWLFVAIGAAVMQRLVARRAAELDARADIRLRALAGRLGALGAAARSSFIPGALLRAPDGRLGAWHPARRRRRPHLGARSSTIREHSEAWLFRATSRRSFSPIPAASTPPSS